MWEIYHREIGVCERKKSGRRTDLEIKVIELNIEAIELRTKKIEGSSDETILRNDLDNPGVVGIETDPRGIEWTDKEGDGWEGIEGITGELQTNLRDQ